MFFNSIGGFTIPELKEKHLRLLNENHTERDDWMPILSLYDYGELEDNQGNALKTVSKRKKYVANTHIMDKKKKTILEKLRYLIREIQNKPTPITVLDYNAYILGIKNYFKIATHL